MRRPERQAICVTPRQERLHDVDQVGALYAKLGADCLQIKRGGSEDILIAASLPALEFKAMNLSRVVRVRGATLAGHVTIQVDRGSNPGRYVNGELLGNDDVVVALGAASFEFVTSSRYRGMNFTLPDRLVIDALAQRAPGTERMAGSGKLYIAAGSGPPVALIRGMADPIFFPSVPLGGARVPEFASAAMVDALISALLFPWDRDAEASFRTPYYQRMPVARRAEDFMRANLGNPIMLHDICRAARASERTVAYAFRDVYGIGPKHFLRLLRLHQARHELKSSTSEASTVETIAHSYGLWHAGHFFTNYRRLFGETPRQTYVRQPRDSAIFAPGRSAHASPPVGSVSASRVGASRLASTDHAGGQG